MIQSRNTRQNIQFTKMRPGAYTMNLVLVASQVCFSLVCANPEF